MSVLPDQGQQARRLIEAGRAQLNAGAAVSAMKSLREALAIEPRNTEALELLAHCHLDINHNREAREVALEVLAINPTLTHALRVLTSAEFALGNAAAAIAAARRAVELAPDEAVNQLTLAHALVRQRQFDEAERRFLTVQQLRPEWVRGKTDYAHFLLDRDRRGEADVLAAAAAALDPVAVDAVILRGRIALLDDRLRDAREHALLALRLGAEREAVILLTRVKFFESWLGAMWWAIVSVLSRSKWLNAALIICCIIAAGVGAAAGVFTAVMIVIGVAVALMFSGAFILQWMLARARRRVRVRPF